MEALNRKTRGANLGRTSSDCALLQAPVRDAFRSWRKTAGRIFATTMRLGWLARAAFALAVSIQHSALRPTQSDSVTISEQPLRVAIHPDDRQATLPVVPLPGGEPARIPFPRVPRCHSS